MSLLKDLAVRQFSLIFMLRWLVVCASFLDACMAMINQVLGLSFGSFDV